MSQQPQSISLADLDFSQLTEVRKQIEEELNHLTNSFAQLKQAQAKFKSCIENVGEVNAKNSGKAILVPLTNSLYVPGKVCDSEHVLVDIGTGYYVKKTRPQALKHYKGKVDYIQKNLETLEDTIQKKRDNMNAIMSVMQAKLQTQQAQSSQSASKT
ncbi:Prefoldin alpha subunit [Dendrothele bispora CBS 962.96]|uniref:Prefoldin alpha subunit n=1 Tax=Dendrothele bispora (strain CBS 962.96) TaxID=1314807 RepID=A0A4S8LG82_DENBC|nr:Prefoldin alpha subunit [Dendrothele bispora CBS 962.96]